MYFLQQTSRSKCLTMPITKLAKYNTHKKTFSSVMGYFTTTGFTRNIGTFHNTKIVSRPDSKKDKPLGSQRWYSSSITKYGCIEVELGAMFDSGEIAKYGLVGKAAERKLAIVRMNSPPANTFEMEQAKSLNEALKALEENELVRGFVLTSSVPNFFSGGVNLPSFMNGRDYWSEFWQLTCDNFRKIYSSRLLSIASVNGHCLALGTVFMLACHDRYALIGNGKSSYKMGLNEVRVGLPLPDWLTELTKTITSQRITEKIGADGPVLTAEQALKYGLIDELFQTKEELFNASVSRIKQRALLPERAQVKTMQDIRKDYLAKFDASMAKGVDIFVDEIMHPETQRVMKESISKLKNKN
ncbi:hypothetical protein BB558_002747 [Smittium angustum]|uniref:Enoyl-CoA hydratase n=1 Tax=Smittium angustum TaxID=133377 RepID=A0A2U1J7V8_SMIAN|nr:hypothetical protein BB558_002747 [Smittium angustum]